MLGGRLAQQALALATTAALARLLGPAAFGLLAMVTAVTGVLTILQGGLSVATVQREDLNHSQVSGLFWISVALGTTLTFIVIGLAPFVAWFYDEPRLLVITPALAGTFFLGSLGAQPLALLQRRMRFAAIAWIEVAALCFSSAVAVALALLGAGYWALVAAPLVASLLSSGLAWQCVVWRPAPPWRSGGVGPLLRFAAGIGGAGLFNYLARNLDNVIVGRFFGEYWLGQYDRAYRILLLPLRQISTPLTTVAQPLLSRLQNDPQRFARTYYAGLSIVFFLGMPVSAFSFVAADLLVLVLLGTQWLDSVALFKALAPAALLGTTGVATGWVFVPLGQTRRLLRCTAFGGAAVMIGFLVGARWGTIGVAWGYSISLLLVRTFQIQYAYRLAPPTLRGLWRVIWRPTVCSLGAAVALGITRDAGLLTGAPVVSLPLCALIYTAYYLLGWLSVPGGRGIVMKMYSMLSELVTGNAVQLGEGAGSPGRV